MKQPIKMTPGDDLHLTALMAPFSLNLVVGQDRQHLLSYGRAAFAAGKESAGQRLHQIQEPASVSNATSQAAPAAVAVPDERAAFEKWARSYGTWEVKRDDDPALGTTGYTDVTLTVAWQAIQARAALAATLAAAAPVVLTEQDAILLNQAIELLEDLSGEKRRRGDDSTAEGAACSAHAVQRLGAALLAGVSAPAAHAVDPTSIERQVEEVMGKIGAWDIAWLEWQKAMSDGESQHHITEKQNEWLAGGRELRALFRTLISAAPQAQADARDAEITWPKSRDVGRFDDMSPGDSIRVGLDSDNDVYVSVCGGGGVGSVEFCNPGGSGGGQSSRTRVALLALMVAMEADNAEDPSRDWWARRPAQAAQQGGAA